MSVAGHAELVRVHPELTAGVPADPDLAGASEVDHGPEGTAPQVAISPWQIAGAQVRTDVLDPVPDLGVRRHGWAQ